MYCCSQEKETCALLFLEEEHLYIVVHYCYHKKETGALLVLDKGSHGALLFSGEGDSWCTTVLKETETGALLLMFSGEGDWCSTVLGRRAIGLYLSLSVYLDKRFHTDNG